MMEYIKGIENFKSNNQTAVTIGKFDALHLGHRYLIDKVVAKKLDNLSSVVIIFSSSPRIVLGDKEKDPKFIITKKERYDMLFRLGVEYLLELEFDKKMIHTEPEDFLRVLKKQLNIKYLCVGEDFRFGYKGRGDIGLIENQKDELEYDFYPVKKLTYKNHIISSTRIRSEISKGNLWDANKMLGFDFFVKSKVRFGNKIGRTIGYPTINLEPTRDKLLPPLGVYATNTKIGGEKYFGMTNIGVRPTIEEKEKHLTVETHLFDFEGEIYEKEVEVSFLKFIREEKHFSSIEELKEQIKRDEKEIRIINFR